MSDDSKVRVWLEREKDLHVEVHVVWKRGFTKEGRQEDIYDDWLKSQSKGKMETQEIAVQTSKVNPQLTLQECLRFSSQPEQLEEDNTWYCNKCQDHV
jgi:ubiquitin carboxyl-terminal hydrolase 4/11/15